MKKFIKDTHGSATLWAAFIAIVLCMLSVVAYTGATLYSAYRTAQTELERAASISVDRNMENRNVRDLVLGIPQEPVLADFENYVELSGWEQAADGSWKRFNGERLVCELRNLTIEVHDDVMNVFGVFVLHLPWTVGTRTDVEIPMSVRTKVIYLD
jgi:hypothetical protein